MRKVLYLLPFVFVTIAAQGKYYRRQDSNEAKLEDKDYDMSRKGKSHHKKPTQKQKTTTTTTFDPDDYLDIKDDVDSNEYSRADQLYGDHQAFLRDEDFEEELLRGEGPDEQYKDSINEEDVSNELLREETVSGEKTKDQELSDEELMEKDFTEELKEEDLKEDLREENLRKEELREENLREELLRAVLNRDDLQDGKKSSLRNLGKFKDGEISRQDLRLSELATKDDILRKVLEDSESEKSEQELLKLREELLREELIRTEALEKKERMRARMAGKRKLFSK